MYDVSLGQAGTVAVALSFILLTPNIVGEKRLGDIQAFLELRLELVGQLDEIPPIWVVAETLAWQFITFLLITGAWALAVGLGFYTEVWFLLTVGLYFILAALPWLLLLDYREEGLLARMVRTRIPPAPTTSSLGDALWTVVAQVIYYQYLVALAFIPTTFPVLVVFWLSNRAVGLARWLGSHFQSLGIGLGLLLQVAGWVALFVFSAE